MKIEFLTICLDGFSMINSCITFSVKNWFSFRTLWDFREILFFKYCFPRFWFILQNGNWMLWSLSWYFQIFHLMQKIVNKKTSAGNIHVIFDVFKFVLFTSHYSIIFPIALYLMFVIVFRILGYYFRLWIFPNNIIYSALNVHLHNKTLQSTW